MGDFGPGVLPRLLLFMSRDRLDPPSLFGEGIFCLAWIMGTTADSGRNPGLSEKSH
jgi:hypothetical protein